MVLFRRERRPMPPTVEGGAGDSAREALVAPGTSKGALAEEADEPPVVARMVIEIRSDGTRTIARGALEDVQSGERVAVQAHGSTPMALAASLAKTIFAAPALARHAVRALIENRLRRP